tara:strand:- start:2096 stop:2395 length:300 start_codon:yes stop_codon:yes gene_type:complete
MKKGPLSNEEKSFIESNVANYDLQVLADKMNRSTAIIQKFVDTLPESPKGHTGELFARKEDRGVTVMTQAASMAGDETKENRKPKTPERFRKFIHKIKE